MATVWNSARPCCATRRTELIASGQTRVARVARQLTTLRGVADISGALFSAELFGTRTFANGRRLGALTGLVPVPYRSDQRVPDEGISKAGPRRIAARRNPNCVGLGAVATE